MEVPVPMKKAQPKRKPSKPLPQQPTQTVRLEAPIEGGESMMTFTRQLEREEQEALNAKRREDLTAGLSGGWPEHSLGTS